MTKTERWYALVEELRAVSPRPRSARWLAERFEVSRRTIERDLDGLLQAGVPLYTEKGRTGGWVLDEAATLGTPALAAHEVAALAVAVTGLAGTPFADAGRTAMQKLVGSLPADGRRRAEASAARVGLVRAAAEPPAPPVPVALQRAVSERRVLRMDYVDAAGAASRREVEPLGLLGAEHWYLVAWCRLRDGVRGFRLDRLRAVDVLAERAPDREVDLTAVAPGHRVVPREREVPPVLDPAGNSDSTVSLEGRRLVAS